jgi:protein TonB
MITHLAAQAMAPVPAAVTRETSGKKLAAKTVNTKPVKKVLPETEKEKRSVSETVAALKKSKPEPEPAHPEKVVQPAQPEGTFSEHTRMINAEPPEPLSSAKSNFTGNPEAKKTVATGSNDRTLKDTSGINDFTGYRSQDNNYRETLLAYADDRPPPGMIDPDALEPFYLDARIISLPEPAYPVLSRKKGEEGRVVLELEISAGGKVLRAQIAASSSYPRLDRAALESARKALFDPALKDGKKVGSVTRVAYRFKLEK